MVYDVMAKRCGEADGDVAIITTVVLVDDREAAQWYRLSAEQGNVPAR